MLLGSAQRLVHMNRRLRPRRGDGLVIRIRRRGGGGVREGAILTHQALGDGQRPGTLSLGTRRKNLRATGDVFNVRIVHRDVLQPGVATIAHDELVRDVIPHLEHMRVRIRILILVHGLHQIELAQLLHRIHAQTTNQLHLMSRARGRAETELHRIRQTIDVIFEYGCTVNLDGQLLGCGGRIRQRSDGDINAFAVSIVRRIGCSLRTQTTSHLLRRDDAIALGPFPITVHRTLAAYRD